MHRATTTSATTLRLFARALDDLGVDSAAVLRLAGIDPALLAVPEARIPNAAYERVWSCARKVSGDPCIGLHAGERARPRAVNVFGYLLLSSETIGAGVRRVVRYQLAVAGAPFISIVEDANRMRIHMGLADASPESRAIHTEYGSAMVLQWTSWVSDSRVEPIETRFAHAPRGDPAEYRRILHGPVYFDAKESEIDLSRETLDRPSVHANPDLAELHEEYAARLLGNRDDMTLRVRVRRKLAEELDTRRAGLGEVAARLGMSARSLQRRLAAEGTSFREVLDDLRRELAREHLERQETPLAEIAYLTGFSEPSAFTRAVRRWFGRPPGELRRSDATPQDPTRDRPANAPRREEQRPSRPPPPDAR